MLSNPNMASKSKSSWLTGGKEARITWVKDWDQISWAEEVRTSTRNKIAWACADDDEFEFPVNVGNNLIIQMSPGKEP